MRLSFRKIKVSIIFLIGLLAWAAGVAVPVAVAQQEIRDIYQQAETAFNAGEYQKAINLFEKVLDLNPKFAPAYNAIGLCHKQMNTPLPEVIWYFKTALEYDPNFVDASSSLAKAYYGLGQFDNAEKVCLDGLKINPDHLDSKLSLGWIYLLGKGKPKDAIPYFKDVFDQAQLPNAALGLGMAYFMSDDRVGAMDMITALKELKQIDMATQLENMVRGNEFNKEEEGRQLVHPVERPPPRVAPGGTTITGASGVMRVRLRGKLINMGNAEIQGSASSGNPSASSY